MNVTDIKTEAPEVWGKVQSGLDFSHGFEGSPARVRDMLEEMFKRQLELELKYEDIEKENGFDLNPGNLQKGEPLDLDIPRNQWFLKDAAYRMVEEVSEATNCLKNKPWKTTHVITDQTHFIEEMADAQHFWIRFWLYVFGSPEKAAEAMYKMYFKKSEVNKFRQESNY